MEFCLERRLPTVEVRSARVFIFISLTASMLVFSGCTTKESSVAPSTATAVKAGKYLLDSEPPAARDVIAAKMDCENGDDLLVVGRIGGSENPWIEGRAAFSIVDGSLKACSDIPGDSCPLPWDYCCETDKLASSTALVKVIDEQGVLVNVDARELLSVKELSTVVVQGKASRDENGNLTILASGVFVRPASAG